MVTLHHVEVGARRKLVFRDCVGNGHLLLEVYFVLICIDLEFQRDNWLLRIDRYSTGHLGLTHGHPRRARILSHIFQLHRQLIGEFSPQLLIPLFLLQPLDDIHLAVLFLQKQLDEPRQLILWQLFNGLLQIVPLLTFFENIASV